MKITQEQRLHDHTPADTQLDLYTIEGFLEKLKSHTTHIQETIAVDSPHDLNKNKE